MVVPWDLQARRDRWDIPVLPVHLPQVGTLLRKASGLEQAALSLERSFQQRLVLGADLSVRKNSRGFI